MKTTVCWLVIAVLAFISGFVWRGSRKRVDTPAVTSTPLTTTDEPKKRSATTQKAPLAVLASIDTASSFTNEFIAIGEVLGEPNAVSGIIVNRWQHPRQNLSIEYSFYDKSKAKVGNMSDRMGILMPGEAWRFRVLAIGQDATSFKRDGVFTGDIRMDVRR